MQKFPNLKDPYHFLATLGGLGLSPIGPGTVGSIFGWFIFIVLSHFISTIALVILTTFIIIFSFFLDKELIFLIKLSSQYNLYSYLSVSTGFPFGV